MCQQCCQMSNIDVKEDNVIVKDYLLWVASGFLIPLIGNYIDSRYKKHPVKHPVYRMLLDNVVVRD